MFGWQVVQAFGSHRGLEVRGRARRQQRAGRRFAQRPGTVRVLGLDGVEHAVSWSKSGIGKATLFTENQAVSNLLVADQQAGLGVARTVGGSVVVPSFASGGASGPVVARLKFLPVARLKACGKHVFRY